MTVVQTIRMYVNNHPVKEFVESNIPLDAGVMTNVISLGTVVRINVTGVLV